MTRTEKALVEYYKLSNELAALKGAEPAFTEIYFEQSRVAFQASKHKLYQLNEMIESKRRQIEKQRQANEVKTITEDYYNTKEGRDERERISLEIAELKSKMNRADLNFGDYIDNWVEDNLGSHWQEFTHSSTYIKFGIVGEDNKTVFGSDIEIYFGDRYHEEEQRFEINVGCMGSFDPTEKGIESRAAFYTGLADFMSSPTLGQFKQRCLNFSKDMMQSREELSNLNNRLMNPLGL